MADRVRWQALARLAAVAFALALAAAGCAPPPPVRPLPAAPTLRARYEAALRAREGRAAALEADLTLWAASRSLGALPTLAGRLALAGPAGLRLELASPLGLALDLAARGDTLEAWLPSEGLALRLSAASDTLGIPAPGPLGARLAGALWRVPGASWDRAVGDGAVLELRWLEGEDSVSVQVGEDGLPRRARLARERGRALIAEYVEWEREGPALWPSLLRLRDGEGEVRVSARMRRPRAPAGAGPVQLAVAMPHGAEPLSWTELLRRLGGGERP